MKRASPTELYCVPLTGQDNAPLLVGWMPDGRAVAYSLQNETLFPTMEELQLRHEIPGDVRSWRRVPNPQSFEFYCDP